MLRYLKFVSFLTLLSLNFSSLMATEQQEAFDIAEEKPPSGPLMVEEQSPDIEDTPEVFEGVQARYTVIMNEEIYKVIPSCEEGGDDAPVIQAMGMYFPEVKEDSEGLDFSMRGWIHR